MDSARSRDDPPAPPHIEKTVDVFERRRWTTAELRSAGVTKRVLRRWLDSGRVVRVRRGVYVSADTPAPLVDAARLGARLGCVSLLSLLGVFVRNPSGLHVHIDRGESRLPPRGPNVVAHWRTPLGAGDHPLVASVVDALVEAVRCQQPRDAIATLDSAWHLGLVDESAIAEVFTRLPARFAALRPLLDPRSEAGTESLMRLLLRALGHRVDVQVRIPGVGRVDLVVDGWLIVECDSRAYHGDWAARRRDVRRDLAAARQGYTTVRPLAEDILSSHDEMVATMRDVLRNGPTRAAARTPPR